MKAIWNGAVIAESDATEVVDGNHYFPPNSLNMDFLQPIDRTTTCSWKGLANYFDVVVNGQTNSGAAWVYKTPSAAAASIKEYVAFWKGVEITK
jgi:uncharacterized protein (DUF427 family)